MAIKAVIATQFDPTGLKKATSEFGKIGSSIKGALGAAAITASIIGITSALDNAAKAAVADSKSQALLANQLRNTTGATDAQIAGVEDAIQSMSKMAAVADDDIRPAMSQLVRATGDVGQATKLTNLALDISAATGKDVTSVATALGKAYQGNSGALTKLGINVKGMKDPLGELQAQFKGAAEAAADADPFQRMKIILGELQETLGRAVLPIIKEFANFLNENAPAIDAFFGKLGEVFSALMPVLQPLFTALMDLAMVIGDALLKILPPLIEVFNKLVPIIQPIIDVLSVLINAIITPLAELISKALLPILDLLIEAFNFLMPFIDAVAVALGETLSLAVQVIIEYVGYLLQILDPVIQAFKDFEAATGIDFTKLMIQFNPLLIGLQAISTALATVIWGLKLAKAALSGDWTAVDNLMKTGVQGILDAQKIKTAAATIPTLPKSKTNPLFAGPISTAPGSTKPSGSPKKTKAQIAAEKSLAELKKFQESLAGVVDLKALTTISKDMGEFEKTVTDSFDSVYAKIADAPTGTKGLEKLKSFLNAQKALLVENAKQRDAIIKKRSLAEALIEDVKGALTGTGNLASLLDTQSKQITTSVTKIVNGFSVTTKQTVDEVIGAKGVVGRLKEVVAKTKAFAGQLTDLKKAGLAPDLFKQIVDAGPDVGGQLATEILSGGADSVAALNSAFTELQTVAGTVAEQTAVVMYNNGVEVAGGLVNGLLSQEQALVDAAKTLADAFNAAYQAQIMDLQVPNAPVVTPKVSNNTKVVAPKVIIKASPNTKSDAQKVISSVNKFYQSNTGRQVTSGRFVF